MNKTQDINEADLFIENLRNIISHLKLNKAKLNKKLGWPANKLTKILSNSQAPLIKDAREVRKLFGLPANELSSKQLSEKEIDDLAERLNDVKRVRISSSTRASKMPISYIVVVLFKRYNLNSTFTKKNILSAMPSELADYSIEWEKTRLKKHIEKVHDTTNKDSSQEHKFKLIQDLPSEMIEKAIEDVGTDWLDLETRDQ